ncbi:PspA/IM30 family protein [Paenibacillus koleovorans]|uniref:PspA/IM30 family protein n=1 Tax=Paenibacillus koleovorans TaxID=121608 RepID=UPI000FDBE338|nr:PspA/IM30 family protein [Paenibacillus koleovorans]
MSIMKRVRDISVATLNERLEQSEDPVRLIDQYLSAQRQQIEESERLYQQMLVHAQSIRHQVLTAEQMKEKREQQALLALKAGEEQVAKMALQEKLQHEETYDRYASLYEESKLSIIELEQKIEQLKLDFNEVLSKRQYYMTRLQSVRLQQQMNARMNSLGGGVNGGTFTRLEERISNMEHEARSLRDVRGLGKELMQSGAVVQQAIEREMLQLRQKLEKEGWLK